MLYSDTDWLRECAETTDTVWRPSSNRDYSRVLHSPSFRRLQGKTQVFPGHESDFFRNRLTHSLEVAQISEGIADRLNETSPDLVSNGLKIDGKLCAVAGLAHDLGHPPFGHNGEAALDISMLQYGGFEGNAQSLRIVSRVEKKLRNTNGQPIGLGLCYRTLASILKYDKVIPHSRREGDKLVKGYYLSEEELVREIKRNVTPSVVDLFTFKTVECSIMDIADDIAYSTFDLEDSMKAGFLTPSDILCSEDRLLNEVARKVAEELKCTFSGTDVLEVFAEVFDTGAPDETAGIEAFQKRHRAYSDIAKDGYLRTALSSELVKKAMNAVELRFNSAYPVLSKAELSAEAKVRVEVLKQYTYVATIYSSRVKLPEYRGFEVVKGIFDALSVPRGFLLMPDDVREQHDAANNDLNQQMRVVCDFVAGMTDRYAMEFFGRLHSDSAQSMFKPL